MPPRTAALSAVAAKQTPTAADACSSQTTPRLQRRRFLPQHRAAGRAGSRGPSHRRTARKIPFQRNGRVRDSSPACRPARAATYPGASRARPRRRQCPRPSRGRGGSHRQPRRRPPPREAHRAGLRRSRITLGSDPGHQPSTMAGGDRRRREGCFECKPSDKGTSTRCRESSTSDWSPVGCRGSVHRDGRCAGPVTGSRAGSPPRKTGPGAGVGSAPDVAPDEQAVSITMAERNATARPRLLLVGRTTELPFCCPRPRLARRRASKELSKSHGSFVDVSRERRRSRAGRRLPGHQPGHHPTAVAIEDGTVEDEYATAVAAASLPGRIRCRQGILLLSLVSESDRGNHRACQRVFARDDGETRSIRRCGVTTASPRDVDGPRSSRGRGSTGRNGGSGPKARVSCDG